MRRPGLCRSLVFLVGGVVLSSGVASAQVVAMSGEYGNSEGRISNFPLNPPKVACVQTQDARCHAGKARIGSPVFSTDPLGRPSSGVGVPGAGVVIMGGGLNIGEPFTIPPGAFQQNAGLQFTPVLGNPALIQLNTTLSFSMPAASRAVNPPSGTRVFQASGWNASGNGQAGRAAASTTPISTATQTVHDVTLRYKAGPNAFGGTMAALEDGNARLFLTDPFLGSGPLPTSYPLIGTRRIGGDDVANNPTTRHGAGWDYTGMGSLGTGIIRNFGGIAASCTASLPPAPAGCGLVTDFEGQTVGQTPGVISTRHMFAWTTGTVEVLQAGTVFGFPFTQLLTAMGYDTISSTGSGSVARNIGLVAGSYTLRDPAGGIKTGLQIIGLDMQFTPEPRSTAALAVGLGLLALLGGRRLP